MKFYLKPGNCKIANNYKTWVNKTVPSNLSEQGIWGSVILSKEWAGDRHNIRNKDSNLKLEHQFIVTIETISWWVVIKIMSSIYLSTSHFSIYSKHIGGMFWFVFFVCLFFCKPYLIHIMMYYISLIVLAKISLQQFLKTSICMCWTLKHKESRVHALRLCFTHTFTVL